jgi:hypothetical protein
VVSIELEEGQVDTASATEIKTGETRPATVEERPPATPVAETVAPPADETRAASPLAEETKAAPPSAETVLGATGRPETVAATEPPAVPPERRRRTGLYVGAAAALLALAGAGYGIGAVASGSDSQRVVPPQPLSTEAASAGPIRLTYRSDWRPTDPPSLGGVELASPIGLAPRSAPEGAGLAAGATDAQGPTLLPAELRSGLEEAERETVRLGEIEAYRYRGLRALGVEGDLTVYVVPTDAGVVTLGCSGASASALQDCERIAATLRLGGVRAYPVGPSRSYASKLSAAVQKLNDGRAQGLSTLNRASTPQGQATAAGVVGTAYVDAAKRLKSLKITPESAPANAGIVHAFERAGDAYSDLASAARAGSQAQYDTARSLVREREAAARRAIADLRELGYAID